MESFDVLQTGISVLMYVVAAFFDAQRDLGLFQRLNWFRSGFEVLICAVTFRTNLWARKPSKTEQIKAQKKIWLFIIRITNYYDEILNILRYYD